MREATTSKSRNLISQTGVCSAVLALGLLTWARPGHWLRGTPCQVVANPTPIASAGPAVPLGFSPRSYEAQARWEKRFLQIPDALRCEKYLRRLTRRPHVAGTPGDRRVTQYIYDEFKRAGLNPEIVEYHVLLSYPQKVEVELV